MTQGYPYQGQYSPPQYTPPRTNGLATAGFVVALIGAVLALIPFIGVVSWAISPIGLILAVVGLATSGKRQAGRGLAIAGVVLGVVGLLICGIYAAAFASAVQQAAATPPVVGGSPAVGSSDPAAGPLTLEVTGEADEASVTYSNETGGIATSTEDLPFSIEVPDPGGLQPVTLTASPEITSGGGQLTCTIRQGGQVVSTQSADGDYAIVSCSG